MEVVVYETHEMDQVVVKFGQLHELVQLMQLQNNLASCEEVGFSKCPSAHYYSRGKYDPYLPYKPE